MKKILALILAMSALFLCACGDDNPAVDSSAESIESSEQAPTVNPPSISMIESEDMSRFDGPEPVESEESVFVKESGVEYGTVVDGKVSLSITYMDENGAPLVGVSVQFSDGAKLDKYITDGEGKIEIPEFDVNKVKGLAIIGTDGNGIFFGTMVVKLAKDLDATPYTGDIIYYAPSYVSHLNVKACITDGKQKMLRLSAE